MNLKKVKIASIFVNEEKKITSKKDGKVYDLCEANCKIADDSAEYAGKYVKLTFFAHVDKDESKNRTATSQAEYFKTQNNEKEVLLDITEEKYVNKEGVDAISLRGKLLTKAQKEVASQFIK